MAETNDVYDQVFSCIASGTDYTQNSKIIFDQLAKKAVPYTKNFVSALFDISNTPDYPANTKFYALYLLVKATETKNKVLIEQLVKNSDYMNKLFQEAQTDRSKPLGEKGKKLFSKTPTQEDAMIGRNYMILLLEALSYWNKEYGSTKKSEVGYSFNAIATTLSTKIPLPTTYHYIGQNHRVTDNFHLEPAKAQVLEGATPQAEEDIATSEAFLQLISCISSEEEYVGGSKLVFSSVEKNNQKYNKTLLQSIYEVLSKPEYGNNLKFHSLYLLGQLLETENKVFVSQVAQETKLLNHIAKEGAAIGKTKPTVSDDKNPDVRYKKNSQVLLLEIVRFADSKYGSTDTKSPFNNFKVLSTSLAKKTTFPEEYLFINTSATGKPKKSVKIVEEDKKAAPIAASQTEDPFMKQVQACIASGPAFADGHAAIVNTLNQSTEEKVLKYFDGTLKILNSPEQTPKSKFYALYLITKASETNNGAGFVTVFTHSKGLMDKLFQDAQFDAKKAPEQRGANYFSKKPTNDESVIGNNYIELLAETFKFWGEAYGTDNKKSPLHILNAINGQLTKTTKIPEQYYYVNRNLNSLDSKDLSRFELIPYKNLPKSAPKNAAAANPSQSVSGNKPVITVSTPKPQEETKRPDDLNMKALETDMNKLAQSKVILAEFLESNDDETVDGQLVSLMFQDVGSIYNNEILMHVDPLVDSTHPDKDKYMNLIFKEGDVQDKLELEHNNFLQGKIPYTELRKRTLPYLVVQDSAASVKGSRLQESKDVSASKPSPQHQHNHPIDLEEEKIAQAYLKKSQASDLMYSESEKASPQVQPKMMQSHASDLIQDHDSHAEIPDTRSRPPAPRSQKVDLESEEEKKTSKRSPSPKVVTQKFSAGDLIADADSAGLKPKPKEKEKEKESVRPKVVPQRFQSGELMADPDSPREMPTTSKVVARSPSYKVVKQKFMAGDLLNDVDQSEVANIAHTQSVMFSPPKKPVGSGSGEKQLGQSVRISPSKDYNMEISKIGQSIKMSKAKISSLSNIQDSIKKSFVNVGKEPPKFKPLPDMAAMENIEDEIIRLNKEKEELRRENMLLRDQTSNMIEDFEHKQHNNAAQIDDLKKLLNEYQDRINNAQNQLETFKSDQALADVEREKEREREIEIRTKKAREEEKERAVKPVKEVHQVTPRDPLQQQQQFATPEQRKSMIGQQSTSPILDSFIRAQRSSSPEKVFFPPADVRTSQYQASYISPGRGSTSPYVSGLASGPNVKGDYVLSTPIIAAAGVLRESQRPLESGIYQSPNVNTSPYRQAPERSTYTSNYTGVDQFVTAGPTYSYSRSPPQPERRVTTDHPVTYVEAKSNSALKKSPNKPSSYRHNLLSSLKLRIKDTHTAPNTVNNYKLACLQKQSVLYENQDLRIATSVAAPLYQTSKRNDLNITLEFTNKSNSTLRDFTTIFSEVYNVTLSVKNEVSNLVIEPGRTLAQQIVFSFEEWPLQVSQIYASYKVAGRREDVDVYLPTLVTQFMNFKPSDGVTIGKRFEQETRNVVQGDEFHLNQSIVRNSDDFKRIFNFLGALDTSRVYGDEAVLGGVFKLNWQRSEYMLKIDVTRAKTVTFAILAQDDNVAFADIILETLNFLFGRD